MVSVAFSAYSTLLSITRQISVRERRTSEDSLLREEIHPDQSRRPDQAHHDWIGHKVWKDHEDHAADERAVLLGLPPVRERDHPYHAEHAAENERHHEGMPTFPGRGLALSGAYPLLITARRGKEPPACAAIGPRGGVARRRHMVSSLAVCRAMLSGSLTAPVATGDAH